MHHSAASLRIGTAGYLIACTLWGLNLPLVAQLLKTFDPLFLSPLRQSISALTLAIWVAVTLGPSRLRSPVSWIRVAIMGAWVSGFLLFYNLGLMFCHPITAAAVLAGAPVYMGVVSRVMTGARFERGFWGATLLTLIGAAIAIQGRAQLADTPMGWRGGEVLLIIGSLCWNVYTILSQRWFDPEVPQLRRTWFATAGAVPFLLVYWAFSRALGLTGEPNLAPSSTAIVELAVAAVLCSAVSVVAWNVGISHLGVQTGGLWQNTVPVWAVLISAVFFGVHPLPQQLAGGGIVMLGVLYMQWVRLRESRKHRKGPAPATQGRSQTQGETETQGPFQRRG